MDERSYEGREEAVSILGAVPEIKITREASRVDPLHHLNRVET